MSPGNVDDVNAPQGMSNIVQAVMDYVHAHTGCYPSAFEPYDQALHALWPELYKASPEAHLRVAISIYIDIAEGLHFSVPAEIGGLKL